MAEAGRRQAHLRYSDPEPLPVLRVYRGSMILGVVMRGPDGLWYVGMAGLIGYPSFATDTDAIAYLSDGGPCVVEVVEPE